MADLPHGAWPIEFGAQLFNEFTFRPSQAMVVDRNRQHALLAPAVTLDLFG